jgi:tetratricopeptide (TPR) repeat protein
MENFRYQVIQKKINYIFILEGTSHLLLAIKGEGPTFVDVARMKEQMIRWTITWPEAFHLTYLNEKELTAIYQVVDDQKFTKAYELCELAEEDFSRSALAAGYIKLDEAIKTDPKLASAWIAYGAALLSTHHWKMAQDRLEKALQIRAEHPLALFDLAEIYRMRGDAASSRRYFDRARASIRTANEFAYLLPSIDQDNAKN